MARREQKQEITPPKKQQLLYIQRFAESLKEQVIFSEEAQNLLLNTADKQGIRFDYWSDYAKIEFEKLLATKLRGSAAFDESAILTLFAQIKEFQRKEDQAILPSYRHNLHDNGPRGWLSSEEIIALTEKVNTFEKPVKLHVANPFNDSSARDAHRRAEQIAKDQIRQGCHVVYVPIHTGGNHWELKIFTQKEGQAQLSCEDYNPPMDGKCGDHVVAKILCDAQSRVGQQLYPEGLSEKSSPDALRNASLMLLGGAREDASEVKTTSSTSTRTITTVSSSSPSLAATTSTSSTTTLPLASASTQTTSTTRTAIHPPEKKLEAQPKKVKTVVHESTEDLLKKAEITFQINLNNRFDDFLKQTESTTDEVKSAQWDTFVEHETTAWASIAKNPHAFFHSKPVRPSSPAITQEAHETETARIVPTKS